MKTPVSSLVRNVLQKRFTEVSPDAYDHINILLPTKLVHRYSE